MPFRKSSSSIQTSVSQQLNLPLALLATGSLAILFAATWVFLTIAAVLHLGFTKLTQVAIAAHTTPVGLVTQGLSGWLATPQQTNHKKNILVLGTDTLTTRGTAAPLTDTILVLSLDLTTGVLNAVSIPRDTWSEKYHSRLNAIYALALQQGAPDATILMQQEIEALTQVPVHHTLLITLDEVSDLIDLAGGVQIKVPEGFIDQRFPRPDVDVTVEKNPAKLYQTVEFQPGVEVMNGERALHYIRSRHAPGIQGSDDARSVRQQLVIESLMHQLLSKPPAENIGLYGQLYAYYQQHFATFISMTELIATAKVLYPHKDQIKFYGHSLSVYPQDPQGVLVHPPEKTTQGMWLYKIRAPEQFGIEVKQKLQLQ